MKLAVNVAAVAGVVTECEIAPASDQLANTKRVPPEPCGEVVAIVWLLPGTQLKFCGAVSVLPSTMMLKPDGTVVTVIETGSGAAMLMEQLAGAVNGVGDVESVTRALNGKLPAVSGVPVMAPVVGFKVSGVGSAPDAIENV